jgi:hypothetical protein
MLMCDVSKLMTEERHTHSNIHGWTPEHEIILLLEREEREREESKRVY